MGTFKQVPVVVRCVRMILERFERLEALVVAFAARNAAIEPGRHQIETTERITSTLSMAVVQTLERRNGSERCFSESQRSMIAKAIVQKDGSMKISDQ